MLFSIDDFVSQSGGSYRLSHYFDKIKAASSKELRKFRSEVKKHRSRPQSHRFATTIIPQGYYRFSPHNEMLLHAIEWELSQRSKVWRNLYEVRFAVRKWWVGLWRGADLKRHPQLGQVVVYREHGNSSLEFYGLRKILLEWCKAIWGYIKLHHWKIITAIISLLGILTVSK